MKLTLFLFLIFLSLSSFGQVIYGTVVGDNGNPIPLSQVCDTLSNESTITDQFGNFRIPLSGKVVLEISHPKFEAQLFEIEGESSSSIARDFTLENRVQLVDEVIISSNRMKVVVDQKAINVIDYLPFDDAILTLKSYKRERILSIEGSDTTFRSYPLGKIKPTSLFRDCFENIHLLTEDSSYQIWMDTTLQFISRSSLKEFNQIVKPCIADFNESKIFENFTNHKQKYILTNIETESKKRKNFHIIHDQITERVAKEVYDSIIRRYFIVTPPVANVIIAKAWSGDVLELVSSDKHLNQLIGWYVHVRASELNIQSFQSSNKLYTIDQHSDSIHIFNQTGELLKSSSHSFVKSSLVFDVLHDRVANSFYELKLKNGVYHLSEIPVEPRKVIREIKLDEAPLCKNIQVHDDWVYFMIKENDFYQINQIYLGGADED